MRVCLQESWTECQGTEPVASEKQQAWGDVTVTPCSKELFTVCHPARKVDAPKRESLLCKQFWYLLEALQASFHFYLITEAKATYLLPYSAMGSSFPWSLPFKYLEKLLLASLSRFNSKQSFKPYCPDPSLCSPSHPWTALLKGGLCWFMFTSLSTLPPLLLDQTEPDRGCSRQPQCSTHRFLQLDRWEQAVGERR